MMLDFLSLLENLSTELLVQTEERAHISVIDLSSGIFIGDGRNQAGAE